MTIIISKIASIFILILVGIIAYHTKVLTNESRSHLTSLLLNITAPALVLSSSSSVILTDELISDILQISILSIAYYILATIFAYIIFKSFKLKPLEDTGVFIVAIVSINCGFMGFPISKSIFGDEIFFLLVIHNVIFNIYTFGIAPILFTIGEKDKAKKQNIVKLLLNPSMIASASTLAIIGLNISFPAIITDFLSMVGNVTIPLSMIIIGIQLAQSNIIKIIKNNNIIIASITSMFLIPVLSFLIIDSLPFISDASKLAVIFVTAFPSAVIPTMLAEKQGKNSLFIAETVSLTTTISIVTIPIISMLLASHYHGS